MLFPAHNRTDRSSLYPDPAAGRPDSDWIRQRVLDAYGLKAHDAGLAPVPLRIRIWRAMTFAYRRGKAVDWRSYNAAEAAYREQQAAYETALARRMQETADLLSAIAPDGLRFEWREEPGG